MTFERPTREVLGLASSRAPIAVAGLRRPEAEVAPLIGPHRGVPVLAGAVLLIWFLVTGANVEFAVVGRDIVPDMLSENALLKGFWTDFLADVAVRGRLDSRNGFFGLLGAIVRPAAVIMRMRDSSDGSPPCLVGVEARRFFLGA